MTARAADGLDGFLDRGRATGSPQAEVAGFDETGLRVAGQAALGALRPHRQVHPDHLPPQARHEGHRRRRGAGPLRVGSRCTTPGRRMTPTPTSNINCAVPTRCASWPPSPTPRPPMPTGAGPPRPPTRSSRCRNWSAEATAAGAADASTRTRWPTQVRLYRSAAQIGVTQTARADQQGDAQAQRPGPPTARPARRLPALHHRLADTHPTTTAPNATSA